MESYKKHWERKADDIYQFLVDEEDARACTEIDDKACKVVPGNFLAILLAQFLTKLSDALSSSKIVLPWLMSSAGVPTFFSGILVPIRESGSLLPQLLIAGAIRQYPVRKWLLGLGCFVQAMALVGIAFAALYLTGVAAGWAVVALLVVFSLARGLVSICSKDVIGKTVPKSRRGRLTGYSATASGVVVVGLGLAVAWMVFDKPSGLEALVLLSAVVMAMGGLIYCGIHEYAGATEGGASGFKKALQSLAIVRQDRAFRRFVWVRALLMGSGLSAPFIVLAAQQTGTQSSLAGLGMFIMVSGVASMLSGFVWGKWADVSSRALLTVTSAATGVSCLLLIVLLVIPESSFGFFVALYGFQSVIHEGIRVGRKTYILDMAGGEKRTDYVAVSNSIIGVLLLMVGAITALIANHSLMVLFVIFALMSAIAFGLTLRLRSVSA